MTQTTHSDQHNLLLADDVNHADLSCPSALIQNLCQRRGQSGTAATPDGDPDAGTFNHRHWGDIEPAAIAGRGDCDN